MKFTIINSLFYRDPEKKKRDHCDVKGGEFDGCTFRIHATGDKKEVLLISMFVNCGDVVKKFGMVDTLKSVRILNTQNFIYETLDLWRYRRRNTTTRIYCYT